MRISSLINTAASIQDWMDVYRELVRWELKLAETDNSMSEMLLMQKRDANSNFCKFVKRNYEDWVTGSEHPLMSHEIFRTACFPSARQGEKTCFILVDNFRLDQWKVVLPLVSEFFNVGRTVYHHSSDLHAVCAKRHILQVSCRCR